MTAIPMSTRARRTDAVWVALTITAFVWGAAFENTTGYSGGQTLAPALHGTPGEAIAIFVRNTTACLLLIAFAHRPASTPRLLSGAGESLCGAIPWGTAVFGGILAAHPDGLQYFPHAPAELLAAALAGAWPLCARSIPPTRRATAQRAAIVVALLAVAALLETFAVPHA
ncbi:MAG: hypothetical protein Q7T55_06445 [Solirubrobacteraceae bacterium]|nr:hypothetical protein [Solirubrobacteraceae bacterium]